MPAAAIIARPVIGVRGQGRSRQWWGGPLGQGYAAVHVYAQGVHFAHASLALPIAEIQIRDRSAVLPPLCFILLSIDRGRRRTAVAIQCPDPYLGCRPQDCQKMKGPYSSPA
eukprot:scaffold107681_cov63-Phaeocystis_antarctica.AAC.1